VYFCAQFFNTKVINQKEGEKLIATQITKPGPRRPLPNNNKKKEAAHRINQHITAPIVRVVGENFEPKIVSLKEALELADQFELDLVEISPQANPPVCKIMDYQKFLYEQKKKQKEIKQKSAKIVIKEIRLGPQTDDHDFEFKVNHAIRFLKEGCKVKVDVFFKGRSIVYKDQGELILLKFAQAVEEYGKPEQMPKLEGKRMIIVINPKK
jgi:translation initiation factor IF-3